MGLKEIRIHRRKYISRAVIVALSAQPPGVNKLCVCVEKYTYRAILTDQNDLTHKQKRTDHCLNSKLQT
jgi:hypothetical protein